MDAARVIGGYVWLEERLFEILGGWVPSVGEPEVKLHLAADSLQHAWHASFWRERLPALREMEAEAFVAPVGPGVEALVAALQSAASPTTIEKLAGVYRVVLPRQVAAYQSHLDQASPVTDGPTIRALHLVLADELADWQAGEVLVQGAARPRPPRRWAWPRPSTPAWKRCSWLAEVDGNRTRRTGIARPNRFEGGGAHQVPGHLRLKASRPSSSPSYTVGGMKKILLLAALVGLTVFAVRKLRTG